MAYRRRSPLVMAILGRPVQPQGEVWKDQLQKPLGCSDCQLQRLNLIKSGAGTFFLGLLKLSRFWITLYERHLLIPAYIGPHHR